MLMSAGIANFGTIRTSYCMVPIFGDLEVSHAVCHAVTHWSPHVIDIGCGGRKELSSMVS